MEHDVRFDPAAGYSLDALGEIFTRSFEGYFYPMMMTGASLAGRVRVENLDLHRSLVMCWDAQPVGIALIGIRGERAWCGGFGLAAPARGQGLARRLTEAMLDQARQAGAREFGLEVIIRNTPAIKAYLGAGMSVRRDLRVLEWRGDPAAQPDHTSAAADLLAWPPRRLLADFERLHPLPAAWQRDLPVLLVRQGLQALALVDGDRLLAYTLYQINAEGRAQLADLGAERADQARVLLAGLQQHARQIVSVNEPADSPLMPAFEELGFVETERQHELVIEFGNV